MTFKGSFTLGIVDGWLIKNFWYISKKDFNLKKLNYKLKVLLPTNVQSKSYDNFICLKHCMWITMRYFYWRLSKHDLEKKVFMKTLECLNFNVGWKH